MSKKTRTTPNNYGKVSRRVRGRNGKNLASQATAVIRSRTSIGRSDGQKVALPGNYKAMQSVRSSTDTALALAKIARDLNVQRIKHITPEMASAYLEAKQSGYASQKSLDRDRKALSIALGEVLPRLKAIKDSTLSTRAYKPSQLKLILNALIPRNSLAVKLAYAAGLRAHELLTLHKPSEGERSRSRTWTNDRFSGREGEIYLVTGKGGLTREVLLPHTLSNELEKRRHSEPVVVTDRQVNYLQRYDIGGGNNLSSAFTKASQRTLGFSTGLHGVRHRYAQERVEEVKALFGISKDDARDVVAQELGHFRGDITETYLR